MHLYFDFVAPSVPHWVTVGVRLIERPGYPSQRCGTVIDFARCNHSEHLYPIVLWDSGAQSFTASDLIDVAPLADGEQISLPL
jgi:hypothetical protein